jgi:rsbT co-antagonist protein RsbR
MNLFERYPTREGFMATVYKALAGEPAHIFVEYQGIPWEAWYVPLRDANGQVVALASISLDVTEAKRTEKELLAKLELIERQKEVIRSLSTPIIEVWDRVLTLPLVGVVDSTRVAEVMDDVLTQISRRAARFAILDLTGVDTVDTGTAEHLLKLAGAIRLLGAESIITGIQPRVAQTMTTLGVDLGSVLTHATLRAGLEHCMQRMRGGK